jgi:DNA-binding NarL/FixJ family response regulator
MAYAARIPATCNAQAPSDWHASPVLMRCLLVDDNAALLSSARTLLDQQGLTIVGTASTSVEALQLAAALQPDVVLVDIVLGDESGFDLARRLAESTGAAMAVIMISTAAESDYADLVAESPAAGFLPKAELSAAGIRRILAR